jgi:transcriptional regulator with XRE-family HTH domain
VTVTIGGTHTPLLAGADPFERFPQPGGTSATSTNAPTARGLGRETEPPRGLADILTTVTSALTPTSSAQPPLAAAMRNLIEHFQVTRANIEDVFPLLGFGSLPQAADPLALKPVPRGSAARALTAVADLRAWLGMTEEQIADLAGFSRRNYSNWRAGQGSYPKTVRGLFEIHALISGLVRALGRDGAVSWIALPSRTGNPRHQLLATSAGRAQLLAEAQPLLFARVEPERPAAEFDEETLDVTSASQRRAAEVLMKRTPQRRRRPG